MMRAALCLILGLTVPAQAWGADRTASAWRALREHRLLSDRQLSCVYLLERDSSRPARVKVGVYEKHDARCGGDPETTHRLFDLELDQAKGRVFWDLTPGATRSRIAAAARSKQTR